MLDNITLVAFFDELEKIALNRTEKYLAIQVAKSLLPKEAILHLGLTRDQAFKKLWPIIKKKYPIRSQGADARGRIKDYIAGVAGWVTFPKSYQIRKPKHVAVFALRETVTPSFWREQLIARGSPLAREKKLTAPLILGHEVGHTKQIKSWTRKKKKAQEIEADLFAIEKFMPAYRKALREKGLKIRF